MDAETRKCIHESMVRLSDGDRAAFDVLLSRLWPAILAFAQRGVGPGDAEDIAQEVFFKICSRIADFDRDRDGVSWAFGIASYEVMTQRRRIQRRKEVPEEPSSAERADGAASQEERLLTREIELALQEIVGALSSEDRCALGFECAEASGRAGATLRKRRQRAIERLRGLWRHVYGES